jgi:hypothetical protein
MSSKLENSKLKNTYSVTTDGYLSDTTIVEDIVHSGKNVVIEAAPGIGKSYALITKLRELSEHFVFAADTTTLADDLGSSHELPVYYKGQTKPDPKKPFITIYDWVYRLPNQKEIDQSNMILVVDEWHSIITYYGFRGNVISQMVDAFSEFKQVIGLTGTHIAKPEKFMRLKASQKRDPIKAKHVSYESLWGAIRSEIEHRGDMKHFVSLYDKGAKLSSLKRELKKSGFEDGTVRAFNAKTKASQDSSTMMVENVISNDVSVVISTYTQGFSINEDNIMVHIAPLPGALHWVEDIAQVIQRFRNPSNLSVNIYFNFPKYKEKEAFNRDEYYGEQLEEAKRQIEQYRTDFNLGADKSPSKSQSKMIESSEHSKVRKGSLNKDKINLVNNDLKPNVMQIVHNVSKKDSLSCYRSKDLMSTSLKKYNVYLSDEYFCPEVSIGKEKGTIREDEGEFKKRVEEALSKPLPYGGNIVADRIRYLSLYFRHQDIKEVMMEYGQTLRKWKKLRRIINAQTPISYEDIEFAGRVYKEFEVGERYNSHEIKVKMNKINKTDKLTEGSRFTNNTAVSRLKDFFKVSRKRVQKTKGGNKYEITSDNPLDCELKGPACGKQYGRNTLHFKTGWID